MAPWSPTPTRPFCFRASGLKRIAEILESVDRHEECLACWQSALEALDEAFRRGSDSPKLLDERLMAMARVGNFLPKTGKLIEAEAMMRRIIAEGDQLARGDLRRRIIVLVQGDHLAHVLWDQGRREEAIREFEATLGRFEKLRLENPTSDRVALAETTSIYTMGLMYWRHDRKGEAEGLFRKCLSLAEAASRRSPDNERLLRNQYNALNAIAQLIWVQRPEEALAIHRRSVATIRMLAARFPTNSRNVDALLDAANLTSCIVSRLGRPFEAESELAEAIEEGHRGVRGEPAVFDRTRALVLAKAAYANLLRNSARPGPAIEQFDQIIELLRPWAGLKSRLDEITPRATDAARESARLRSARGEQAQAADRLASALDLVNAKDRPAFLLEIARYRLLAGDPAASRLAAEQAAADPDSAAKAAEILKTISTQPQHGTEVH